MYLPKRRSLRIPFFLDNRRAIDFRRTTRTARDDSLPYRDTYSGKLTKILLCICLLTDNSFLIRARIFVQSHSSLTRAIENHSVHLFISPSLPCKMETFSPERTSSGLSPLNVLYSRLKLERAAGTLAATWSRERTSSARSD